MPNTPGVVRINSCMEILHLILETLPTKGIESAQQQLVFFLITNVSI